MADIWGAARAGNLAEVEHMVGQDPGLIDARDRQARTPLMCASQTGHLAVVRLLLDKGVAIDVKNLYGWTALLFACCWGCAPVVSLLLERGADDIIGSQWRPSPLILASEGGHLEVVRLMLDRPSAKATINHREGNGATALWWACYKGRWGGREGSAGERGRPHYSPQTRRHHPHGNREADSSHSLRGHRRGPPGVRRRLEVRFCVSLSPSHRLSL
jgi:ankyrin repeat protein